MATRSLIARENEDKTVTFIYCHNDGYIHHGVGETLYRYYDTPEKVDELLALGDLSTLGDAVNHMDTEAYHRDFNEEWDDIIAPKTSASVDSFLAESYMQAYSYLYSGGAWYVYTTLLDFGIPHKLGIDENEKITAVSPDGKNLLTEGN